MSQTDSIPIYELSVSVRATWQAHSLSNIGNNGSNRTMPRRQLLVDGTETDAVSGNILKHYHASLLAEYLGGAKVHLCPACASRDGRRAAALTDQPLTMASVLQCGLCDTHGFLVTAKNAGEAEDSAPRQRLSKHSLVEFSFALALPGQFSDTSQLFARGGAANGDGQMIIKKMVRSGQYGLCVRYKAAGIGLDTDTWQAVIRAPEERRRRHQANLQALRDCLLSPVGAMTSTLLPHLTGLAGAVAAQTAPGRAPLYSPLIDDYIEQLQSLGSKNRQVWTFTSPAQFDAVMDQLIQHSTPVLPGVAIPAEATA